MEIESNARSTYSHLWIARHGNGLVEQSAWISMVFGGGQGGMRAFLFGVCDSCQLQDTFKVLTEMVNSARSLSTWLHWLGLKVPSMPSMPSIAAF